MTFFFFYSDPRSLIIRYICIYLHTQTFASMMWEMFTLGVCTVLALAFENLLQGNLAEHLTCDLQLRSG